MTSAPVVIIGAGPAGLACASRLLRHDRRIVLIDDNLQPGGQYFRQLPPTYVEGKKSRLLHETERARRLARTLEDPRVLYLAGTTAWACPGPLTVAYAGKTQTGRVEAEAIVIATGAYDRPFPFPGWTLPGVISAGGSLNLAKGSGLIPGGRVVVAGNGPLVLVAAATLAAAGAAITHVIEAQPTVRLVSRLLPRSLDAPRLFRKGLGYRMRLLRSGVRVSSGAMVSQAAGHGKLEAVEIAPLGADGRPAAKGRQQIEAETLVVGYGLVPSNEFSRLVGCQMTHVPGLGGWVPARSDTCETSLSGIYTVGDAAGIGGVELAILEGMIVADAIAGRNDQRLRRSYARLNRFRYALAASYETPKRLSSADPDTIICRCEELRLRDLTEAVRSCATSLGRLKSVTRLGMGRCQGRNCMVSAAALCGFDEIERADALPRSRPPARPVRIADLVQDTSIGPARVPDEAISPISPELKP